MAEKYNASNITLEQILNFIKSGEVAIPEIQRPFVWKPRQVRDLIDSLYTDYPTGCCRGPEAGWQHLGEGCF